MCPSDGADFGSYSGCAKVPAGARPGNSREFLSACTPGYYNNEGYTVQSTLLEIAPFAPCGQHRVKLVDAWSVNLVQQATSGCSGEQLAELRNSPLRNTWSLWRQVPVRWGSAREVDRAL